MYDMKNTILALIENLTHIAKQNPGRGRRKSIYEEEAGALEEMLPPAISCPNLQKTCMT